MSSARTLAVARRIVQQFRRDRRTLGLILVVPVVIVVVLGYVIRNQEVPRTIAVVNESAIPALDAAVAAAVEATDRGHATVLGEAESTARLRAGDVQAVLVVSGEPGALAARLTVEGVDPSSAAAIRQLVVLVFAQLQPAARGSQPGEGAQVPLAVDYLHGGPQYDTLDFFAPGLIGYFAFFFVFLLTAVSFLRERVAGTLERLMATPVSRFELVAGYIVGFGLFALLQALAVTLVAVFALRIHYAGSLVGVFAVVAVLALMAVNLGIFLSTYARTELQAVQFIPLVIVPQGILSGLIWPVAALPGWLQPVSRALPMTYAISALRDVMLKGQGLGDASVAGNVLAILGFAVALAFLAVATLRREVV